MRLPLPMLNFMVFLALALGLGFGTARFMIDEGSAITTQTDGSWVSWFRAGSPDADPYTRAHMARAGWLPIGSASARYYSARVDDNGDRLSVDCDYRITSGPLGGEWWSLTLFDKRGRLIANTAGRYGFNSGNILRAPDRSFRIEMARMARPGNWLPMPESGEPMLVLQIYGAKAVEDAEKTPSLPVVQRVTCR